MRLNEVIVGDRIRFPRGYAVYCVVWISWRGDAMYRVGLQEENGCFERWVETHKWPGGPVRECVLIEESAKEELHAI
jgi:hypothetical protein